jgi:hypothetical protein
MCEQYIPDGLRCNKDYYKNLQMNYNIVVPPTIAPPLGLRNLLCQAGSVAILIYSCILKLPKSIIAPHTSFTTGLSPHHCPAFRATQRAASNSIIAPHTFFTTGLPPHHCPALGATQRAATAGEDQCPIFIYSVKLPKENAKH